MRLLLFSVSFCLLTCTSCTKEEAQATVQDVDQTAALKNVTLTYKGMSYELTLPPGALDGRTFEEHRKQDSATFTDPLNYSVRFLISQTAENKKPEARDAKFDGMTIALVLDTILSGPLNTVYGPFTVLKNTSMDVTGTGTVNLATHKNTMLYVFRQIVAGADIATTTTPSLNYKIGSLAGTIPFPPTHQNIPTAADAQTKAFLQGLLDSGVFK